jgi:hypothetical protein
MTMRWDLDQLYRPWHMQQAEDERFYNAASSDYGNPYGTNNQMQGPLRISASNMPANFDQMRTPTGKTIIDTAAEHASGNFPRIHVPRKRETAAAQELTTLIEKFLQGCWYRAISEAPLNPLRAWAQLGGLRGAIGASLIYNDDKWPDLPEKPADNADDTAVEAYEDAVAMRKSSWPFELDWVDPVTMFPDPASEGKEYIIIAFTDQVYRVKRRWPKWDKKIPGRAEPLKDTDSVDFIAYWDKTYYSYIVGNLAGVASQGTYDAQPLIKAYDGVVKHKYGFLPYFFTSAGYGMPTGAPQFRYQGLLTPIRDLLLAEMRNLTHTQAIVAQQAFPWLVAQFGVEPNMELGGVTRVPQGTPIRDAIVEMRPVVPINELMTLGDNIKQRIEGATIPDTLSGVRPKGIYSGYHESILVGTGRARLRPLSDALEHVAEWANAGFLKLVENKLKAPISVWGKGMGSTDYITIKPSDINGNYESFVNLVPDLPQDTAVDIGNGQKLFQEGVTSARDFLETYAHRENAEEILRERAAEDLLKNPLLQQQMAQDLMAGFGVPGYGGGPMAVPGVRTEIGSPTPGAPAQGGAPSTAPVGVPPQPTAPQPGVGVPAGGPAALAGIPGGQMAGGRR